MPDGDARQMLLLQQIVRHSVGMPSHVFDWIVPGQLGACANPARGKAVVAELRTRQIRLLVNLHEQPDPPELLAQLSAQELHLPTPDFQAPTQEHLERGVAAIAAALGRGTRVAVHCGAGLGRTGAAGRTSMLTTAGSHLRPAREEAAPALAGAPRSGHPSSALTARIASSASGWEHSPVEAPP